MQAYVTGLSDVQVRTLRTRILCGHGGVGLATSLLQSASEGPGQSEPDSQTTPWCMCGNCRPMGTPTEDVCCHKNPCITRHEEFYLLCVNYLVLTVAILGRVDIRADPIDYSPSSYRKAAYRQYIYWVHGYLGRGIGVLSLRVLSLLFAGGSLPLLVCIWALESTEAQLNSALP